jgi:choline dehydrogenase-like flavoprotein
VTEWPSTGWLSAGEFAVLEAICDTLLPSLEPPAASSADVAAYYRCSAGNLRVAEQIVAKLGQQGAQVQADIRLFLSLFTTPLAGLLLAGSARPFLALPPARRERFLLALANSPLGMLRQGYQGIKRLAGLIYFSTVDQDGRNPNWPGLDYTPPQPAARSAPAPILPMQIEDSCVLEADVVVIGSGAGGGVVAGELARANKRVIVLEKGGYNHEGNFTMQEGQAMSGLFLNQGALATRDLGLIMMAGSTLGGGTVVNWMTCFRTPAEILSEWDAQAGLPGCFTGPGLQQSFDAVERRIGVNSAHSQHNGQNRRLFDGAKALGYQARVVPRNAIGCAERCGACSFGCPYGCNQSTMKTYLQDAYDHGAQIIVHSSAEQVLIERGRAIGVVARVQPVHSGAEIKITVRARAVVLAAGALQSPVLLLRSGVANPNIGRHLHLHPSAVSVGAYPEKVYAWQGVLQSAYSDQFARLDGNYGYMLEVAPTHPGLFGLATPWYSARSYRDEMASIAHLASIIVLTRDKGEGRVTLDRNGTPLIDYTVSAYDHKHMLHGLQQGARIHLAAGAERVISLQNKPTDLWRTPEAVAQQRRLQAFDKLIQRRGLRANQIMLFSAHQMGTCRIGANPRTSVIDEQHQVHGVKGLFVCDGSSFPSACGVNPMLSIMALAHHASRSIITAVA